ncbi:hypothetical protein ONE63_011525 [Megalurothrips usitatus]|uniref:DDE Tnp4 domain-containing protein n=1 Tax=Megalurothrips usitatus TaxID=439358 RepID=A0AAV7WZQ6_9NEOP|nr:hypothetical protein ONE63_011525 [Megalurothrips usitatus]
MEEEEDDYEQLMMALARIATQEIMDMEEGILIEHVGETWFYFTVNIDEYHSLGEPCFKMHFRMSRTVFEDLVRTVHHHLVERGRLRREKRPFIDIMLMVVWLMATPDSFRSVASRFGVQPYTLWYFYSYRVIEALRELAPTFITWPSRQERVGFKNFFQRHTGFPGVVGSIDGTHINISAPLDFPRQYVNRHDAYSINVQCVVDHTLLVRQVHIGEVGSMNDQRVFRRSPLYHNLLQRDARFLEVDEHLVGDGGYTLADYLLTPFANNGHLTAEQLNFNRRLSQCRVRVENAFARAKGKWRRLKYIYARNRGFLLTISQHHLCTTIL